MSDTNHTESEAKRFHQAQRRHGEGVAARKEAEWQARHGHKPTLNSRERVARQATDLRCYQGDVDWVVARDVDDALAVIEKHYGEPYHETAGVTLEEARGDWCVLNADTPLTIWHERGDYKYQLPRPEHSDHAVAYVRCWPIVWQRDEYHVCETAPVWWWVQTQGRGFLCSSEW